MDSLFKTGNNYKYIMSVWKERDSATDTELLECIRSECDPCKIVKANIENGGNQVGVLGLIIEEIGRRKIRNAAPIIVEYVAWPYYDDFWVHLVPRCFEALCEIGDDSIVGRFLELTSGDIAANSIIANLHAVSPQTYSNGLAEPLESEPEKDPRARIIMIAMREGLISAEQIMKWADSTIGSISKLPPEWLCDLSLQGDFNIRCAPEDADIVLSFDERCICIVAINKAGVISLTDTVEKIFRDELDGFIVGKKALCFLLQAQDFRSNKHVMSIQDQIEKCFDEIVEQGPLVMDMMKDLTA